VRLTFAALDEQSSVADSSSVSRMSHHPGLGESRIAVARRLPVASSGFVYGRGTGGIVANLSTGRRLVLWMGGALISFIAAALAIRALAHKLNVFEMMSVRSAGGIAILLAVAALRPELKKGLTLRRIRLHFLRSSVHFVSQIGWALAITMLPFATVFALEFTTPVWVAVLATLLLNERMTPSRAGSVIVCFLGVLIILRPGLLAVPLPAVMMLGAAVTMAVTAILTKKLITTESTFAILFWMNVMQLPMNLAGSGSALFLHADWSMALPLLVIAVGGLSVHYCLTNAFRCGDATIVMPLDFLRVPAIALIGWAFYGEALDAFVFVGAAFIIVGVLWSVQAEARRARPVASVT
jgi:drug/metabolite transporter (DMT)-like permease